MFVLNKINSMLKKILRRYTQRVSKEEMLLLKKYEKEFPQVLTTVETIELMVKNKASLCRYGDAEFDICNQENELDPYQRPSDKLTNRLIEILQSPIDDRVVICIPPFNYKYNNIEKYYGELSFWQWYWLKKYNRIKPLLNKNIYGNSFVSRDAVFFENELSFIKQIWEKRDVVFVYGENGRLDLNSDLFDNINQYKTLLVPPTHAFDKYDDILDKCMREDKNRLFLIAAGPTATVLAYDLSKEGYQALDIGHLPNCYEQYLGNIVSPESLPLIKK